jgi:hypothetical protein
MKKFKQPEGLAPGIYFDLPEEAYHNDPALSHSGITNILVSDYDYWSRSCMNPDKREFKATDAMMFGKYAEMFLLEEKKFFQTFHVAGSSGWREDGRKTIPSNIFDDVKLSAQMLRRDPQTAAYFQHGYAQVSIIYIHPATGMRMRIRPDYLRTFGCIDLKRMRDIRDSRMGWDIVEYGLDLQEQMYIEGILIAKEALRAGKMKVGGEYDKKWLKAFADDPDAMFRFIFQRSTKPYIYLVDYFDPQIRDNAKALVDEGIARYRAAIEKYGTSEWPCGSPLAQEFSIYHLPRRAFDR